MNVLKFGGTSVGSVESILNVKRIVESVDESVVVVVSAVGGITDCLLSVARQAAERETVYEESLKEIIERHKVIIESVIEPKKKVKLYQEIDALFLELENILRGVYLINDCSVKSRDVILSYGERISSLIVSAVIDGATHYDTLKFIKTKEQIGKHILDFEKTTKLVEDFFINMPKRVVVGGFIATNTKDGRITNLGRGGSDYTASILAAILGAESLEIWTDVDGFMTADPRVISSAYVIDKLSFSEAMELCNFGAKVIYPPTIYPVYHKNIPIRILNTFNPSSKGTYISRTGGENGAQRALIKGISSINDTSLLTVQGLGMVGVIGVNKRIFRTLADNGISVFMVAQASSENNTTIAVNGGDTELAVEVLNVEFEYERAQGSIADVTAESGLATVAIVGENMKHTPGIAGRLFGTLGRSGISVIACAQGASQMNISFVIKSDLLRKAINSIHDSFFLSEYKVLNLFITGVGTVGSRLINQIKTQQQKLKASGLKLNVIGIASSKKVFINREGIILESCIEKLRVEGEDCNTKQWINKVLELDMYNSVFVDCTASEELANHYYNLLDNNISVVAANKSAASSCYADYLRLKDMARLRDVKYLFETNVGAGLPIIKTINDLVNSGDRILRFEAVLSGTLNFIFNEYSENVSFSRSVMMAKEAGFAEPDPRLDLSGKDVMRKLVILARESGYVVEQDDVEANLFIPDKLFAGSVDEFWEALPLLDIDFERERCRLVNENKRLRFVAKMDNGKYSVGLKEIDISHPFYDLQGSNNIIMLWTERYHEYPMIIKGYGAGADVTAAGVFADIISIANI